MHMNQLVTLFISIALVIAISFSIVLFKKTKKLSLKIQSYDDTEQELYNEMNRYKERLKHSAAELVQTKKIMNATQLVSFYVLKSGSYYIKKPDVLSSAKNGDLTTDLLKASKMTSKQSAEEDAKLYGGVPVGIVYLEKEELTEEERFSIEN